MRCTAPCVGFFLGDTSASRCPLVARRMNSSSARWWHFPVGRRQYLSAGSSILHTGSGFLDHTRLHTTRNMTNMTTPALKSARPTRCSDRFSSPCVRGKCLRYCGVRDLSSLPTKVVTFSEARVIEGPSVKDHKLSQHLCLAGWQG